jgi:hypothetical protein
MHMIFNQTEFGHIAIATQWRLRLRRHHGRTCSGHPRLPSLKRRKQGVDGRDKRGHDGWVSATAIAMQWRLRLRFSRRLLYLSKTWQPVPTPEASL